MLLCIFVVRFSMCIHIALNTQKNSPTCWHDCLEEGELWGGGEWRAMLLVAGFNFGLINFKA